MKTSQTLDFGVMLQSKCAISPTTSLRVEDVELELLLSEAKESFQILQSETSLESRNTSFLILLATGMGGLQIIFSVLYSHGMAHLQSLGLSKSQSAIAFLAGPISGIFVQPLLGIWSDRSTSRWGRRRPFIVFGTIALIISLLGLAWITSLVKLLCESPPDSTSCGTDAFAGAILIFCVYISIQPVQGGIRALIAETCPSHQQQEANAWVSRVSGLASVLSYFSACLDLPRYMSWFGNTQFKNLSVLAVMSLALAVGLTCTYVAEIRPNDCTSVSQIQEANRQPYRSNKFDNELVGVFVALPRQIWYILVVQFFAWIGWFPYLLYISTYVGDIYMNALKAENSAPDAVNAKNREQSTRIGSLALLVSASVSVVTASAFPALIESSTVTSLFQSHKMRCSSTKLKRSQGSYSAHYHAWTISQCLFALCMLSTLWVSSTAGTVILCGFAGMSWAVANWVPYTLLGAHISKSCERTVYAPFPAATILSLHNVAICLPQIMVSFGSGIFLRLNNRDSANPESVAWVLRIGGIAALLAAYLSRYVQRQAANAAYTSEETTVPTAII